MMTANVTVSITCRLRSPAMFWSADSAAGPVTNALTPLGAGTLVDDLLHGLDRFVGQRLALVAGEVHLDVGGLAVVALRARAGQRVAPQILNVLNVFGVGVELLDIWS